MPHFPPPKTPTVLSTLGIEHGLRLQLDLKAHVPLVFPGDEQAFLVRFLLTTNK